MKKLIMILGLIFFNIANAAQTHCDKPTVIKPMQDYDIIATNTGNISMAPVFSGDKLVYDFSAHPTNKKNKISINHKTGVLKIKAEKKDHFDVTVNAKNQCGTVSNTFNIIIDEEE